MASRDRPTARVQVYFENPKIEASLRREARLAKVSLSRAAESAIQRGLLRRPAADPEDRLLNLDRALRDHMRSQQRDMTIVQELVVALARVMLTRVPKSALDEDRLHKASVEADIQYLLDRVAYVIGAGGTFHDENASADSSRLGDAPARSGNGSAARESRSYQAG